METPPIAPFATFLLDAAASAVDAIPLDRRIVLLGESTHGTEEFYTNRAAITKRLIEERGFTAVVFEADFPFMECCNEYIRGRRATPFPDGPAVFPSWMWRNRCMVELLDWCKKLPPSKMPHLFGMDCYSLFESKKAVLAFLDKHDSEFAVEVKSRLALLDKYETGQQFADSMLNGQLSRVSGHITDCFAKIQSRLQWGAEKYNCSDVEKFSAEQNCEVIIAADEYYRKSASEPRGSQASWNIRDQHMTSTLLRIQHRLDDPKVIVWAHNSHIGDASQSERGGVDFERNETWNLGQMTRATFGTPKVWIIGQYTYNGVVTAAREWGGAHNDVPLKPALPDSFEGLIHAQIHAPGSTIDSKEAVSFHTTLAPRLAHPCADRLRAILEGPLRLQRWVGVQYRPDTELQSHYGQLSMKGCYDQVIFVDTTSALAPIPERPKPSAESGSSGQAAFISRASTQRLIKEYKKMQSAAPPGIKASPLETNLLEWHFVLSPGEGVYAGGEYHGRLDFPSDYPMAPPAFRIFTPSGRFDPGVRLCLSMSDYHPETWNPSWSVETMLVGLQSFMYEESNAIGSISSSAEERKKLAKASKSFNAGNAVFRELFDDSSSKGGTRSGGVEEESTSASVCRFCFSSEGELISPCMCRGTNEWLHLECLKQWQKAVVMSQPTHPKYQTNIDEVCNVCCEPFQGPGIARGGRAAQILEFVGGSQIAALVTPGNLLVSTRESSRENLELAAAHPEIAPRLKTWTRAVFLMLKVDKDGGLVAVSTSEPVKEVPRDIRLSAREAEKMFAQAHALAPGLLVLKQYDGGPCERGRPICVAHLPTLRREMPGVGRAPPSWIFGSLDAVAAAVREAGTRTTVNIVWGYGGWGGTQVLAEIGRGGWGLVGSADFAAQRPDASLEPVFELDLEWTRIVSMERLRLPPKSEYNKRGKR